jgi:hypothetical protein
MKNKFVRGFMAFIASAIIIHALIIIGFVSLGAFPEDPALVITCDFFIAFLATIGFSMFDSQL